jgi:hypothetical protein
MQHQFGLLAWAVKYYVARERKSKKPIAVIRRWLVTLTPAQRSAIRTRMLYTPGIWEKAQKRVGTKT